MAPKPYTVERRRVIDAPAERIFEFLIDFRRWEGWAPWEDLDPQMQRHHSGAASGVGAFYEWDGNRKAGAGSMHVVSATTPEEVGIDLQFTRPFKTNFTLEFTLQPSGAETEVVWEMRGENSGLSQVLFKLTHPERSIGADFERGLEQLALAATHQSHGHR